MKQINISPALLNDIQKTLNTYGYQLKNAIFNQKENNHHYIFSNNIINLSIKIKNEK